MRRQTSDRLNYYYSDKSYTHSGSSAYPITRTACSRTGTSDGSLAVSNAHTGRLTNYTHQYRSWTSGAVSDA